MLEAAENKDNDNRDLQKQDQIRKAAPETGISMRIPAVFL
jgi:hypothetical protein